MIAFRNSDNRYPFLWEDIHQPAGRWHGDNEGPVQYLADTPNGAWAEFLRHEEICEPTDLAGVRRAIWAVEIGEPPLERSSLPHATQIGDLDTYAECQGEARSLRGGGSQGLVAVSAGLLPGGARGYRVDGGLTPADPIDGNTIVLFGRRPDLVGWQVAADASPPIDILDLVQHFASGASDATARALDDRA